MVVAVVVLSVVVVVSVALNVYLVRQVRLWAARAARLASAPVSNR